MVANHCRGSGDQVGEVIRRCGRVAGILYSRECNVEKKQRSEWGGRQNKARNNVLKVAGLVGAWDGAYAILEEVVLDFAVPVDKVKDKALLNLLRVPVGDHHRT